MAMPSLSGLGAKAIRHHRHQGFRRRAAAVIAIALGRVSQLAVPGEHHLVQPRRGLDTRSLKALKGSRFGIARWMKSSAPCSQGNCEGEMLCQRLVISVLVILA